MYVDRRNLRPRALWTAALLAVGLSSPVSSQAGRQATFSGGAQVTQDSELHINSRRGDIVIRRGTGNSVQINALIRDSTKQGDTPGRYTPAEIMVYLQRHPPIVVEGDKVQVGAMLHEDFHLGVDISYDIVAPAFVSIEVESQHGVLEVHGVGQKIEVDKTAGSVSIQDPQGKVDVKCAEGSVQVFGVPQGEWSLQSKSGDVHVVLPEDLAFELDAESKSGRLQSEFPLLGEHEPGRFKALIAAEGPRIHLRSETGAVAIWQR